MPTNQEKINRIFNKLRAELYSNIEKELADDNPSMCQTLKDYVKDSTNRAWDRLTFNFGEKE